MVNTSTFLVAEINRDSSLIVNGTLSSLLNETISRKIHFFIIFDSFDTQSNKWEALRRMPLNFGNCVAVEMNKKFFVVGGVETSYDVNLRCCVYDPETEEWSNRQNSTIANKNANVAVFKNGNQLNVIVNWNTIYSFDTTDLERSYMPVSWQYFDEIVFLSISRT